VYYKNALKEQKSSVSSLESTAKAQQTQLNTFKQKLTVQYSLMDDYKKGQNEETRANNLLTQGEYNEAIQMFKNAEKSYDRAITNYNREKDAVTETINGYLNAIQNESITDMKKYHTNFNSGLQSDWQGLFDYADNIKVGRSFKNYAISSDKAAAQVDVNLDFNQADKSKTLNQWKFNLEKRGAAWIITEINEGN